LLQEANLVVDICKVIEDIGGSNDQDLSHVLKLNAIAYIVVLAHIAKKVMIEVLVS
jgi:hypothetical protein